MRKSPSISHHSSTKGFTLLELLVVIAIIGVLAGLVFPAATGVLRKADKVHAENTAYNLKNAINAYFTEYRKYPVDSNAKENEELKTDRNLMDPLLGADSDQGEKLNPRKIAFYAGKQAIRTSGSAYKKGITLQSDGGGELWDPFPDENSGNHYFVKMDLDYNNRTEKPAWDTQTDGQNIPQSILVWSNGPDKEANSSGGKSDNITTW